MGGGTLSDAPLPSLLLEATYSSSSEFLISLGCSNQNVPIAVSPEYIPGIV